MKTRRSMYKTPPASVSKPKKATNKPKIAETAEPTNLESELFVIDTKPTNENEQENVEESENSSNEDEEIQNDEKDLSNLTENSSNQEKIERDESSSNEEEIQNDEKSSEDENEQQLFYIRKIAKIRISNTKPSANEEMDKIETEKPAKKRKKNSESEEGKKFPKYNQSIEQSYEKFLFGKTSMHSAKLDSSDSESSEDENDENVEKVEKIIQQKPTKTKITYSDKDSDSSSEESDSGNESGQPRKGLKPAWTDEDDEDVMVKDVAATFSKAKGKHGKKDTSTENYAKSLRKNFASFIGDTPSWADLKSLKTEDLDSDDEFFRETTDMLSSSKKLESLKKGYVEYRKLKDINHTTHNEGTVIRAAEFHPSAAVGLVAGLNGTASLFQIDGKSNPKMQSVHFENFPIKTAHFTSDGKQFLVGSQHFGHFFAYDMVKGQTIRVPWKVDSSKGSMQKFEVSPTNDLVAFHGKFGQIHIMSNRSRSKLFTLKMNDEIAALTFSPDGEFLYSHGNGGEVYIWDLKAQECVHKFVDDGCIKGTSIAISRNNQYLSCGSDSGVVNIYKRKSCWSNPNPTPEKIVLNLVTPISSIKFNPTSEIVAMASEVKENAVKLLHLPSMTVFSNFPATNFNVMRPNCMDFSLNGGYFSIGNNRGAANLYRLKHYGNY